MIPVCHSSNNLPSALNSFRSLCAFRRTVTHRAGGTSKGVTMRCYPSFSPIDNDLNDYEWWVTKAVGKEYPFCLKSKDPRLWAHRIVLERKIGRPLVKGEISDHVNGDKMDVRRENLRVADTQGNAQNRKCSFFRGTTWHKTSKKWQATVGHNARTFYLGVFTDRSEAARAATKKREELKFLTNTSK